MGSTSDTADITHYYLLIHLNKKDRKVSMKRSYENSERKFDFSVWVPVSRPTRHELRMQQRVIFQSLFTAWGFSDVYYVQQVKSSDIQRAFETPLEKFQRWVNWLFNLPTT
jgi:hypothetical protein